MKSSVSKPLRNIIAERDSYTCVLCDNPYNDIHHFTPRSKGGKNNPHNLVSLCFMCHRMLHRELPLNLYWVRMGFDYREDWIAEMNFRIEVYLHDYYAEEIQNGTYSPIEHDRFGWMEE